jgi:ABC-type sugar transport system permease subunit
VSSASARFAGAATRPLHGRRDHPVWFLIPALLVLVVFFFVPSLFNFIYAFTNWSSFKSDIGFVGVDNFVSLSSCLSSCRRSRWATSSRHC